MSPFPALRTADPFQLLQSVSNAMMVVPVFYLDTATAEKARDFWELFKAHTEGPPDRPRLLVFRQRLKGREAERWWGNSSIRTFSTLKVRFHNQFLRRTADELWERLEITRREKGDGSRDGGGARRRTPAAVEVDEVEEAGEGWGDDVTAVDAVVDRGIPTDSDTVETAADAERFVVERKIAKVCGTTEVFVAETMAEQVFEPVEQTRMTEPTSQNQGVSFPRLRHKPRLDAEPPLKSALKQLWAPAAGWRSSEDAEIGVGETVFAAWTLKDDPEETVVKG
ncbi:hypothetical protein PInf_017201 [Phytophthora infestans]|nr:hypothetical protein PInf_017201 [Phytophthora infestans]